MGGKTIALGTFPIAEADEKCVRAKALTRAWRSTMRPKPNREWVMLELERLQVRVVSGRLGRRGSGGDDSDTDEDDDDDEKEKKKTKLKKKDMAKIKKNDDDDIDTSAMQRANALASNNAMGGAGMGNLDMSELGKKKDKNPRRNSLVAMAEAAALSGMGGNDENVDVSGGQGGAGLIGGNLGSSAMPNMGFSVNPNQHYEMLKLHHMNLLNEIQETTLMMNLYQQQQLQQQQQQRFQQNQLDQQSLAVTADQQLALQLAQQPTGTGNPFLESLYSMGTPGGIAGQGYNPLQQTGFQQANQQVGLGLGGSQGAGTASNQMQALLRQQNLLSGTMLTDPNSLQRRLNLTQQSPLLGQDQPLTLQEQEELCQARLQRLKQDIAERQRVADVLEGASPSLGAKQNFVDENAPFKRQRVDVDHN